MEGLNLSRASDTLYTKQCNQVALQIGRKVVECHEKGIILCDLKTENCIVDIDADGNANATIIDAGGFYKAGELEYGACFTPQYLDDKNLEAATTGGSNAITPNEAIDAYAFGILLCELYQPLLGLSYDHGVAINQYQWPAEVPDALKSLQNIIQGLINQDVSARTSVETALPQLNAIQALIEHAASSSAGAGAGSAPLAASSTSPASKKTADASPFTATSTSVSPEPDTYRARSPANPTRNLPDAGAGLMPTPKGVPATTEFREVTERSGTTLSQ